MSLAHKYPATNWVMDKEMLNVGDFIAYYDDETENEVVSTYIGAPSLHFPQYISCKRVTSNLTEVINIFNTVVYKVDPIDAIFKESVEVKQKRDLCSCGAKHTSNPSFHLSYCEMNMNERNRL